MDGTFFILPWNSALEGFVYLLRASAFVVAAPVLGAQQVPGRTRLGLALLLSFVLASSGSPIRTDAPLFLLVLGECLAGVIIGLSAKLAIEAATVAGTLAGLSSGLSLSTTLDPVTSISTPTLGKLKNVLFVLVYLAIGGHRQLIGALGRSYEILAPGSAHLAGEWLPPIISMTLRSIELGVRIAAPVIVAGLLVDIGLMLIARAAPQMHILIVGAPVRVAAGLVAVGLSVQFLLPVVVEGLEGSLLDSFRFLEALSRG